MNNQTENQDLPENYEQLKNASNRTSSWRERLEAVEALGEWKHIKIIDILKHRMQNDTVYQVQEAAYRILHKWGQEVQLPARKKGELIKGVNKILLRIKKSLPQGHPYEAFKEKLQKMRSDVYDAYEGDKGDELDSWLQKTWASLSR